MRCRVAIYVLCRIWLLKVVSPNDLAWEMAMQVTEYLQAGVPLLCVFYPDTRTVTCTAPIPE